MSKSVTSQSLPHRRSLGQFFQEEIASPLGLDVYIRLPEEIPNSRLATIAPPGRIKMLFGLPFRLMLEAMNRHSNIYRALVVNPGTTVYLDEQRIYARNLEVPSGGAVGTARAIAQAYSVFATGGRDQWRRGCSEFQENRDGVDHDRIDHLSACLATSTASDPCIVSSYPKDPGGVPELGG